MGNLKNCFIKQKYSFSILCYYSHSKQSVGRPNKVSFAGTRNCFENQKNSHLEMIVGDTVKKSINRG